MLTAFINEPRQKKQISKIRISQNKLPRFMYSMVMDCKQQDVTYKMKCNFQSQNREPNKYNNSITRLVRECWKAIEVRMNALTYKPALKTSQFNMIKTPLVNARTWMDPEVLKTYHSYIMFSLSMEERPSDERTIQLYQKVIKTMKKGGNKYKDNPKHYKTDKYSHNSGPKQDESFQKIKMMIREALNKQKR